MLDKGNVFKIFMVTVLGSFLFIQPAQAYSGWGRSHSRDYRDHRDYHTYRTHYPYPSYGRVVIGLPSGFVNIVIGRSRYYYCDGVFYRPQPHRGYIVIAPPPGVIINTLPVDYRPVVINGVVYYTSNNVYYQYTPQGYVVVQQPVAAVLQQPAAIAPVPVAAAPVQVAPQGPVTSSDEAFTINIPNNKGGYTAVALKRSGDGFVGPQGEFYASFPRVEQLKAMYGQD